jgi:hypothetical protein
MVFERPIFVNTIPIHHPPHEKQIPETPKESPRAQLGANSLFRHGLRSYPCGGLGDDRKIQRSMA